ncbi:oligosaccharide flippase family protein [Microbacterium sp. NPDC055455]
MATNGSPAHCRTNPKMAARRPPFPGQRLCKGCCGVSTKRAVAITAVGNIIAPAVGLLTAPMLALSLGVAGRGELAAATAPLLLASNAATLGLPSAITYFTSRRAPREARMIAVSLVLLGFAGLASTTLIALLSPVLAAGDQDLAKLITLASLAVTPALILAGLRALALGLQRWWLVTSEKLTSAIIRLAALGAMWIAGSLNLISATLIMSVTTFAGIVVYFALPFGKRTERPESDTAHSSFAVLSYGARVWLGSLSGILLIRIGQTLMVPLSGAYELGLFAVAATISEAALIFNAAVSTVVFSTESRKSDAKRLADTTRVSTIVTAVMAILIGLLSIWAVPFLFGEEFRAALPTLWVLLAAVALGNPGSIAGQGLNARHRPELRSASLAVALVANVAMMFALVPWLGSLGAATAQLGANVIAGGLNLFWLKRGFGLPVKDFLLPRRSDFELLAKATRLPRAR